MNTRLFAVSCAIVPMAALSFAAGRMSAPAITHAAPLSAVAETGAAQVLPENSAPLPQAAPATIAAIPFEVAYETLRQASPETLARWVKEIEQISERPKRRAAIISFFRTLVQFNPETAKDLILGLKKDDRWAAMITVKEAAPPKGLRQVSEILLTYDPMEISGCSYDMRADVIDTWSKADPLAAKDFLETHNADLGGTAARLIRNWSAYDPEASWEWMQQEMARNKTSARTEGEAEHDSDWLTSEWAQGFFENDPAAALTFLFGHEPKEDSSDPTAPIVGALFAKSPESTRDYILQLPEARRAEALAGVAYNAARFDYNDAEDRTSSPEFIAEWMRQFPLAAWEKPIAQVVAQWKQRDADALFAWMTKLPAEAREAVARGYETFLLKENTETEFSRVMKIDDPSVRNLILQQLMRATQMDDVRVAVAVELEKAALDPAQKHYLASLIPPEPPRAVPASEEEE